MLSKAWMHRAIALAKQGEGWTNPNPMVGAVIVKDGVAIGEGYHVQRGELHAERNALASCTKDPAGATVYVTLEPCCHHGKTPPCTDALLEAGVARVVIGSPDPNPKVAGKGVQMLRENGVEVVEDFMREECDALNEIFFHYITTGMPYVAMKYAMTADGKLATHTGASQWITGEAARHHVQKLRNRYQAILVGIGTVLCDNPMLNCRLFGGRDPLRVICDKDLRIPLDSQICRSSQEIPTVIACHEPEPGKKARLEALGMEVHSVALDEGGLLDLKAVLTLLGREKEVDSVLIEGGNEILGSVLENNLAQKLYCYVGAKLFGGREAKSPVGGTGVPLPGSAVMLSAPQVQLFEGGDILLEYQIGRRS